MRNKLHGFCLTIVWIISAVGACIVASILIKSKTKCINNNLQIETNQYIFCKNDICTSFNETNISYDIIWSNCKSLQKYYNLTDVDTISTLNMIDKTNNSACYYNYLIKCSSQSYSRMPFIFPVFLMILFVLVIFVFGWAQTVPDLISDYQI
ncbi:Hypothetical protein KVN_LOCUS43 [uncultured virus]|nr:Hypothetical protein KVN_LOCUS43 [uncultured virus]